jgi:hypothetical protein
MPLPTFRSKAIRRVRYEPMLGVQNEPILEIRNEPTLGIGNEPIFAIQNEPNPGPSLRIFAAGWVWTLGKSRVATRPTRVRVGLAGP